MGLIFKKIYIILLCIFIKNFYYYLKGINYIVEIDIISLEFYFLLGWIRLVEYFFVFYLFFSRC